MIYRTLGRTGLDVSVLGMGTGGLDAMGLKSGRSEEEMRGFLRYAFDLGINYFDTSPGYGDGRSERILGQPVSETGRDKMVISTKMALAGGMPGEPAKVMKPSDVGPAVDESLRRLQMDHIDVMLMAVADLPENFDTVINDLIPELVKDGECESLVEAAYRYAAYTSGVTTVMCGTIDRGELEQDIAFVRKGPLAEEKLRRLHETFGHIEEPIGN